MDAINVRKSSALALLGKVLAFFFLLVIGFHVAPAQAKTNELVSVAKQVIRAAATYGLEEAGTRIMGSAWKPFKAMLSPVIGELEKRYPKFFLLDVPPGKPPSAEAQRAARDAVAALENDNRLQQLVVDGFNKLEEGQYEIKEQIKKISLRLDAINVSIDQLSETNDQKFADVMTQLANIQRKLDSMGQSVGFENTSVIFPLAFEMPPGSIEAYVVLYIAGLDPIELSVNKHRPRVTVNVSVPRSGTYSYRLEHQEITTLMRRVGDRFIPELMPIQSATNDRVEIVPNAVYKLERLVELGGPAGNRITMTLSKVLTPEEEAIQNQEAIKALDKLLKSP
jgi:hypothetical protein